MAEAVQRRCEQELGFRTPLEYIYKFEYQAHFGELGSEHELCSVYVGYYDEDPAVNTTEIEAWRWIDQAELDHALQASQDLYTPWFKLEWARLQSEHQDKIPKQKP